MSKIDVVPVFTAYQGDRYQTNYYTDNYYLFVFVANVMKGKHSIQ